MQQQPVRGFWQNLIDEKINTGESLTVLAPMADVTDVAFRGMITKYSRPAGPDVIWTEFVSADGLCSNGREILKRDMEFTENERPVVLQLFTSTPENMFKAVKIAKECGFDGVDINMGCPDKSIERQGAGAALIKNLNKAKEIIKSAQEAAGNMPISVKTRIGFNEVEIDTWIRGLLECNLPTLTVHLRTRKELSLVDAHWEIMPEVVKLAREITGEIKDGGTIILGNGDVKSVGDGKEKAKSFRCDGVMIGRAIFGTPWFFDEKKFEQGKSLEEKLNICIEHTKLFEEKLGDIKNFAIMKKHFKAYIHGFDHAKELRVKLMNTKNSKEVEKIIENFLKDKNSVNKGNLFTEIKRLFSF